MQGVVMAGGLSTRMGQDKAGLAVMAGMPDMLERTASLLARHTDGVLVSARAGRRTRYRLIPDAVEGLGPLGGLLSVMRAVREPLLVLSCDLPFMDDATLETLLAVRAAREPRQVMTAFREQESGRVEPLVAIYEPACLRWLEDALRRGERRLGRIVPPELACFIPYAVTESLPFFNMNRPEDVALARRLMASG